MADYRILARALNDALQVRDKGRKVFNVSFNVLNTSTLVNKVAAEQIQEFHKWQVVIATHGAFEGTQPKPTSPNPSLSSPHLTLPNLILSQLDPYSNSSNLTWHNLT